jgi:hypothetical protein
MVKVGKWQLFPWMMGGIGWRWQGGFIGKKNVSAASYIAAFVNNTKGLQWTQATKRKFIEAENLGSHRCGNCSIITLLSSSTGTTIFSLVNMASFAR